MITDSMSMYYCRIETFVKKSQFICLFDSRLECNESEQMLSQNRDRSQGSGLDYACELEKAELYAGGVPNDRSRHFTEEEAKDIWSNIDASLNFGNQVHRGVFSDWKKLNIPAGEANEAKMTRNNHQTLDEITPSTI